MFAPTATNTPFPKRHPLRDLSQIFLRFIFVFDEFCFLVRLLFLVVFSFSFSSCFFSVVFFFVFFLFFVAVFFFFFFFFFFVKSAAADPFPAETPPPPLG